MSYQHELNILSNKTTANDETNKLIKTALGDDHSLVPEFTDNDAITIKRPNNEYILAVRGTRPTNISDLISDNFLNEARFAESFAGGHFRIKSWGKQKIKYALQQKRVSPVNIKKALLTIDEDAYEKALLNLATKKWNSLKGERGMSRMAKTQSFLNQRGFESNLISPILQALNKK